MIKTKRERAHPNSNIKNALERSFKIGNEKRKAAQRGKPMPVDAMFI